MQPLPIWGSATPTSPPSPPIPKKNAPTRSGKALGNISAYVNFFLPLGDGAAASSTLLLVLPVTPASCHCQFWLPFQCFVTAPGRDWEPPAPFPHPSNFDVAWFVCLNATFTLWIVAIFFLQLAKPENPGMPYKFHVNFYTVRRSVEELSWVSP